MQCKGTPRYLKAYIWCVRMYEILIIAAHSN